MTRSSLTAPDVRSVPVYIYALSDPDGTIRYVGRSADPYDRSHSHRSRFAAFAVRDWVSKLSASGHEPVLSVLEIVPPGKDSASRELAAIERHRIGGKLLNDGGSRERGRPIVSSRTGSEAPNQALRPYGMRAQLARELDVSPELVSRWASGERTPTIKNLAAIEDRLGINWRLWIESLQESA